MFNCIKCGNEITENDEYCKTCGYVPKNKRKRLSSVALLSFILAFVFLLITIAYLPSLWQDLNKPKIIVNFSGIRLLVLIVTFVPFLIITILAHLGLNKTSCNIMLKGKPFAVTSLIISYPVLVLYGLVIIVTFI